MDSTVQPCHLQDLSVFLLDSSLKLSEQVGLCIQKSKRSPIKKEGKGVYASPSSHQERSFLAFPLFSNWRDTEE
ncbi:hypothetical protein [uncultured Nostoc sp.]|uniref:hypothetical protein n=1 Tax=uncultured Nostoc sp. TaxID=340711 RepID=UPI0035CA1EEA